MMSVKLSKDQSPEDERSFRGICDPKKSSATSKSFSAHQPKPPSIRIRRDSSPEIRPEEKQTATRPLFTPNSFMSYRGREIEQEHPHPLHSNPVPNSRFGPQPYRDMSITLATSSSTHITWTPKNQYARPTSPSTTLRKSLREAIKKEEAKQAKKEKSKEKRKKVWKGAKKMLGFGSCSRREENELVRELKGGTKVLKTGQKMTGSPSFTTRIRELWSGPPSDPPSPKAEVVRCRACSALASEADHENHEISPPDSECTNKNGEPLNPLAGKKIQYENWVHERAETMIASSWAGSDSSIEAEKNHNDDRDTSYSENHSNDDRETSHNATSSNKDDEVEEMDLRSEGPVPDIVSDGDGESWGFVETYLTSLPPDQSRHQDEDEVPLVSSTIEQSLKGVGSGADTEISSNLTDPWSSLCRHELKRQALRTSHDQLFGGTISIEESAGHHEQKPAPHASRSLTQESMMFSICTLASSDSAATFEIMSRPTIEEFLRTLSVERNGIVSVNPRKINEKSSGDYLLQSINQAMNTPITNCQYMAMTNTGQSQSSSGDPPPSLLVDAGLMCIAIGIGNDGGHSEGKIEKRPQ